MHALEATDGRAELLALLGVGAALVEGEGDRCDREGGDEQPAAVQGRGHDLETVVLLAEQRVGRDLDVVEHDRTRR
ncbi:MAG: hypothetical protein CMJ85_05550 [Planctomycetes bacterium]|nr:hypothetical protein [Planctomycetota bacterium]